MVTKRFACLPPTKAIRVQSPAGPLPDFPHVGIVPDDAVGRQVFWLPPPFHSGAAPYSPQTHSSALKTSLLRSVQIPLTHSIYLYARCVFFLHIMKSLSLQILKNRHGPVEDEHPTASSVRELRLGGGGTSRVAATDTPPQALVLSFSSLASISHHYTICTFSVHAAGASNHRAALGKLHALPTTHKRAAREPVCHTGIEDNKESLPETCKIRHCLNSLMPSCCRRGVMDSASAYRDKGAFVRAHPPASVEDFRAEDSFTLHQRIQSRRGRLMRQEMGICDLEQERQTDETGDGDFWQYLRPRAKETLTRNSIRCDVFAAHSDSKSFLIKRESEVLR
ncbi:hypothetical protein PR048_033186 [Dryococelus australis]|uniref:Uncharacterized protein n=1 Tax=Dryococelus australis TaxID=614101 RepID=A0ABQ9G3S3_9NEOP|nr:hypothetical protein PR048_033186 [Dryococelus australis]